MEKVDKSEMEYRQYCDEVQRYRKGEERFCAHISALCLNEGFDPHFDADCDMGIGARTIPDDIGNKDNQDIDYFVKEEQEERKAKEQNAWLSMPDFTELYYDFYNEITSHEAKEMGEQYAHSEGDEVYCENMVYMLMELEDELKELEAEEEERRRYPLLEPENSSREEDELSTAWFNNEWCKNLWRSMPGFTELYYDLYSSMPREEVTQLIAWCLNVKCPYGTDWNTIFMLEALEEDGL